MASWRDSQYAWEELLYHKEGEDDANNGVGEVGTGIRTHQEDNDKSRHSQQHSKGL